MPDKLALHSNTPPLGNIIYLPIELAGRELDSKLLVAAHAISRGLDVVIGDARLMHENIGHLRQGIYFLKGMNKIDLAKLVEAKRHGFLVASIDEEAMAISDDKELLAGVAPGFLDIVDIPIAQGSFHAKVLARYCPSAKNRITVCGNPRIDLLHERFRAVSEQDAIVIRERAGPFILINTNFGFVNSDRADYCKVFAVSLESGYFDIQNPEHALRARDSFAIEEVEFQSYSDLIAILSKHYPERSFVLRPHPGENAEVWREHLVGHQNVDMVQKGSVAAWALAADLVIHCCCTTGLEAELLGRPTLSFCPINNFNHDVLVVNDIVASVASIDEVSAVVNDLASATSKLRTHFETRFAHLDQHLALTREGSSSQTIVETFEAALDARSANRVTRQDPRLPNFIDRPEQQAFYANRVQFDQDSMLDRVRAFLANIGARDSVTIDDLGSSLFYLTSTQSN